MKCKYTNFKCTNSSVCHSCEVANRNLCFTCAKYTPLCGVNVGDVVLGCDIVDKSHPYTRLHMNNVVSCKNYVPCK